MKFVSIKGTNKDSGSEVELFVNEAVSMEVRKYTETLSLVVTTNNEVLVKGTPEQVIKDIKTSKGF